MSSHMGTNFLNSCIKVPIDPCNNCPAPVYNRPKVFLSRNSSPTNKFISSANKKSNCELEIDNFCGANGMRSLATFYHSIPEYCEINHLSENEFYSTLEDLRMTYRQLKSKPNVPDSLLKGETHEAANPIRKKPGTSSKCSKKKSSSRKNSAKKDNRNGPASQGKFVYKDLCERMRLIDYERHDAEDRRLCNQPLSRIERNSPPLYKSLSMHQLLKEDVENGKEKYTKTTVAQDREPIKQKSSTPIDRKETLRKSFSYNDLNTKYLLENSNADIILNRTPNSNREDVPKITLQPPSPINSDEKKLESFKNSAKSTGKTKARKSTQPQSAKVPFSFLGLDECTISGKTSAVSPIHPVARPNLAATLRLEVSKKKVKELQNNCTFNDQQRSQIDWEVRKTPAWKSLSHNESHKEILALRLATRKAEQELQKRQYDIQMEIMRQRVKSAPLLLEGPTFWGPHVGKLSHSCHKEGLKHTCQQGVNGHKKKKNYNKHNSRKCSSSASHSRNSNHSNNMNESDELSSLDRAYL